MARTPAEADLDQREAAIHDAFRKFMSQNEIAEHSV